MKSAKPANALDTAYLNGQSDVEKLMRRHLQEPGHVVTDEDLHNINVRINTAPVANGPGIPHDGFVTPLDVLEG